MLPCRHTEGIVEADVNMQTGCTYVDDLPLLRGQAGAAEALGEKSRSITFSCSHNRIAEVM